MTDDIMKEVERSQKLCEGEPRKGKLFLIKASKPKYGTRLCAFQERRSVGCQLHGELIAYEYIFRVAPDFDIYESIHVQVENERETEAQKRKRWDALYSRAIPFDANTLADESTALQERVERLEGALRDIHEYTMSQPAELNMPDDRWYRRCANTMRGIAYEALTQPAEGEVAT